MRNEEELRQEQLDPNQQSATGQPIGTADLLADSPRTAEADRTGDPNASNGTSPDEDTGVPLFDETEVVVFRDQWRDLQAAFVDDPRRAVQDADQLVAHVMQNLAATFADHKSELEVQWQRGDEVATEDLRVALRRYRSFFNRLLNA